MKIRTKRHMSIRLDSVLLNLSMFCVFSYALLEHVSITISMFSAVKLPMLCFGGLCMLRQIPIILGNARKKKYFYVILTLVMFCLMLLASAFSNRNPVYGTDSMRHTIRMILYLAELFALMIWVGETDRVGHAIDFLFRYMLLVVIVTDTLFLTGIKTFYSGRHEIFLVGTKLTVSYFHMDLLALWYVRNNMRLQREGKSKGFVLFAIPFLLAVAIRVDCMTGVIGCLVLFVFFMLMNTRFQKYFLRLSSPVWLVIFLLASVIFPFVVQKIVSIPVVAYLLENVMLRSTNLTGRLHIFEAFVRKTQGHRMWGYGLSNGNTVAVRLFNCANAQNALLQWVLEVGIPTTLVLVALMVIIFVQLSRSPRQRRAMPMVMMIYVYIVLGTVETTFNMMVILWLALIFLQVNAKTVQKPAQ